MTKLEKKYSQLKAALITLDKAIEDFERVIKGDFEDKDKFHNVVHSFRDSLIQRFEYFFEVLWKYISLYLKTKEKLVPEIKSPRSIFKTACQARLISEDEAEKAITMALSRNDTSHMYKEEIADFIASQIKHHAKLMNTLAQRLSP